MRQRWKLIGRRDGSFMTNGGGDCYIWRTEDLSDEDRARGYSWREYWHPVATFWPVPPRAQTAISNELFAPCGPDVMQQIRARAMNAYLQTQRDELAAATNDRVADLMYPRRRS